MDYLELLRFFPQLRANLPTNLAIGLAKDAERIALKPRHAALEIQLPPPRVLYLYSGLLAIQRAENESGITDIFGPGSWIALQNAFFDTARPPRAWALSNAVLIALPRGELIKAARLNPGLSFTLANALAIELEDAYLFRDAMREKTAIGRCAYVIYYVAMRLFRRHAFECPLRQDEMAALAGVSREEFNRNLKALEQDNLIERKGKQYHIFNLEALAEYP